MRTKFSGILTLLLAFVVQISFAQEKTISGSVTDDKGLPLPGVNIVVKNTTSGTQTDFDGNYSIKTNKGAVLTFTYVGFKTEEVAVGDSDSINIQLSASASELEEVVIEAFRNTTKATSNISSVTISTQTIEGRPNPSAIQTLQGQISGLNIATGTGQPGANSNINLRGITSLGGNSEPLFLIDGVPVNEDVFRSLNPNEIQSISVLKDAGATAIYGNRGANGVIKIITKTGSYNSKLKINYLGTLAVSSLQDNDYNLMNSQQLLTLERSRFVGRGGNGGLNPDGTSRALTDAEIAAAPNFDWLDYFFRQATTQSHTLSLSSGSDKATSFTSIGYHDQEGILVESGLKRFNLRNNITGKSDNNRFNYSSKVSINYSTNDEPNRIGSGFANQNFLFGAFRGPTYVTPSEYISGRDLASGFNVALSPLYLIDRQVNNSRKEEELKIIAGLEGSYKLTNNLTLSGSFGADYTNEIQLVTQNALARGSIRFGDDEDPSTPERDRNFGGFQFQQTTRVFTFNSLFHLNYNKTFAEKHTIDASVFTEYFKVHLRLFNYDADGTNPRTFVPGDGDGLVGDVNFQDAWTDLADANMLNSGLFSYFGLIDYDYNQKYGISGTLRRDASFRFAQSNRWGTFYSVSARWNIDQENFMQNSAFDLLKLRGSFGTTGNQRVIDANTALFNSFVGPDLTLDLYEFTNGYGGLNTIGIDQIGNRDLKWEVVEQLNVGLDFQVWNKRFRGSVEYYKKNTKDLFLSQPQSSITGINSIDANNGEIQNTGFDANFNYDLIRSNDDGLNVSLRLVGNYNKQEVIELPGGITEDINNRRRVGGIFNEYRVVRYAGVNPANGNALYLDADGNLTENADPNLDAVWTDKNISPDYQGSFGFDVDYKGFFLNATFNYAVGVYRFDEDYFAAVRSANIGTRRLSEDILRAWTPDNRITDIPSLDATNILDDRDSDRFLFNSDYVRLRFVSFGYEFPAKFLKNTGFDKVRTFVNAENLYTWSKWRGFDAEATTNGGIRYPTSKTISIGFEFGF